MNIRLPNKTTRGGQSKEAKELYVDSLRDFANDMIAIQNTLDFHMSARGWCYVLEPIGLAKGDFDWAAKQIKEAKLRGFLKPGFILEEAGHEVNLQFDNDWSAGDWEAYHFQEYEKAEDIYKNSWEDFNRISFWNDKDYYIQVLVEKSDLMSLFQKVCDKYKIQIANMRGWGSLEQKAVMAEKFMEMELKGKKPILLACGDFDPPGLSISSVLKKQFEEYSLFTGWNPENLHVERIGLNYEFIQEQGLTWINGLQTISGKDLSSPDHTFYKRNTYGIQEYIRNYGNQKCEANAIVIIPELGRQLLIDAIHKYIGEDCWDLFEEELETRREEIKTLIEQRQDDL